MADAASQEGPRSACKSIAGGRMENQDACYCGADPPLYIVADGMAGHWGGKLASELSVQILTRELTQASTGVDCTLDLWQARVLRGLEAIVQELKRMASEHSEYDGLGCTLAVGFVEDQQLYYTHLGDCRIHLGREKRLIRITEDESLAQELYDAHLLSAKQLEHHRWRHIVTNSVSSHGLQHQPKFGRLDLQAGDRLVFSTNGLSEKLDEHRIAELLFAGSSPAECVEDLMSAAQDIRTPEHNATAIVVFL